MKPFISAKLLATVAIALGAIAVASSAHARGEVHLSVGLQVPGVVVKPMPVHVHPAPIYTAATTYYRLHNFARRNTVRHWQHRGPYGDYNHNGIANIYEAGRVRSHLHNASLHGSYRDLDRDGIRNRFDHRPGNPYRR